MYVMFTKLKPFWLQHTLKILNKQKETIYYPVNHILIFNNKNNTYLINCNIKNKINVLPYTKQLKSRNNSTQNFTRFFLFLHKETFLADSFKNIINASLTVLIYIF